MESGGNFEDYIRFLSCHLFGPVNHGQNWKGWERSGEKGLIISDNQDETCLIITINDTSIGDLPLIITISDTCKNQPKRLDFDNTINLSSLIVSLAFGWLDQSKQNEDERAVAGKGYGRLLLFVFLLIVVECFYSFDDVVEDADDFDSGMLTISM